MIRKSNVWIAVAVVGSVWLNRVNSRYAMERRAVRPVASGKSQDKPFVAPAQSPLTLAAKPKRSLQAKRQSRRQRLLARNYSRGETSRSVTR